MGHRLKTIAFGAAALLLGYGRARAEDGAQLRPLCADRPGKATPPCILDAGHLQLEVGLVDYSRLNDAGDHDQTFAIAGFELRAGLTRRSEVELDWTPLIPRKDFASADPNAAWIAFGSGEQRVYLDTPTWWDITPRTIWAALTGGKRVMHVEYVTDPSYAVRQIRLRPEEYRRLWAAIRADFALDDRGGARRIAHPGYGPADAFYQAVGKESAFRTCNTGVARWLRLAGVKTSVWPPFVQGLVWRYRPARARSG